MKRILILLLALMPVMAWAQDITVDHNLRDVLFQKVYDSPISYDEALEYILAYNILDNIVTHGNMIAGDIVPQKLDYTSEGYARMKVPLYLSNGYFTCRLVLKFKEGRYKAEAFGMKFYEGGLGGTSSTLYSGYDGFAFDIAIELVLKHLSTKTTFILPNEDW